jgi:hypothetical protein
MTATHDTRQATARDPAEIEREIRSTQDEMSRTVDEIGEKLSPRHVMNALLDEAEEKGIDARYILDGARRNPLALGMIALGSIWLVSERDARLSALTPSSGDRSGRDPHDEHRGYLDYMSRYEPHPGEEPTAYRRRRDQARANYFMLEQRHDEDETSFRDRLDQATDKLRERRDSFLESAHQLGRVAGHKIDDAAGRMADLYLDNPMVGGVIAALAGALAGAVAPVSRAEEAQAGKMASDTLDAMKEEAGHLAEEVRERKDDLVERTETALRPSGPEKGKGRGLSGGSPGTGGRPG